MSQFKTFLRMLIYRDSTVSVCLGDEDGSVPGISTGEKTGVFAKVNINMEPV